MKEKQVGDARRFGIGFLTSTAWDPVHEVFGAAVSVYGTLLTAVLALLFAVPISFGIAFYLTELAPSWLRRPVGTAIELLAAVPSIIYGMWGFFVIVPIMSQYVEPTLIDASITRLAIPHYSTNPAGLLAAIEEAIEKKLEGG